LFNRYATVHHFAGFRAGGGLSESAGVPVGGKEAGGLWEELRLRNRRKSRFGAESRKAINLVG